MARDERNCFERVGGATDVLCCGTGSLPERLEGAVVVLAPLISDDFPTDELKQTFQQVRLLAVKIKDVSEAEQIQTAKLILSLYTKAARLEGDLSDLN